MIYMIYIYNITYNSNRYMHANQPIYNKVNIRNKQNNWNYENMTILGTIVILPEANVSI